MRSYYKYKPIPPLTFPPLKYLSLVFIAPRIPLQELPHKMTVSTPVFSDFYLATDRFLLPFRFRGFNLRRTLFLSPRSNNRSFLRSSAFAPG